MAGSLWTRSIIFSPAALLGRAPGLCFRRRLDQGRAGALVGIAVGDQPAVELELLQGSAETKAVIQGASSSRLVLLETIIENRVEICAAFHFKTDRHHHHRLCRVIGFNA